MNKMRAIFGICVFLIIAIVCEAKTWSENATDAAYPGMCVYKGTIYPPGEHHLHDTCIRIICGSNSWISGHTCLSANLEGCIRGSYVDKTKPYPECCKRSYTCTHGDGTEYTIDDF